jgi:hypothetical protein
MAECGGYGVKAGGWQMTTGILGTKYMKEMQTALNQIGFTTQSYAYPAIFLILLLGLIGLVCLNGKRSGAITAIASGIAGVVGMVIIITSINS